MMKRKTQIEYPLNPSSSVIIWNAISTAAGLQRWFADHVTKEGKTYTSAGERLKHGRPT